MRAVLIFLGLFGASLAQHTYNDTIGNFLKNSHYAQDFGNLIETLGFFDQLNGAGPFTVFAPGRSGMHAAQQNNMTFQLDGDMVKYHIVNGAHKWADIDINELVLPSSNEHGIRINHYHVTRHITAQGSRVYIHDRILNNGVVHVLNEVMTPATASILDSTVGYLQQGGFNAFLPLLQSSGIADILNDGPITFFAPNADAINNMDNATRHAIMSDPVLFGRVLKYHIVPGTLYSSGIHAEDLPTFEEVDKLHLHRLFLDPSYSADNGKIVQSDISATNGVIHLIDHFLIPHSLQGQLGGTGN